MPETTMKLWCSVPWNTVNSWYNSDSSHDSWQLMKINYQTTNTVSAQKKRQVCIRQPSLEIYIYTGKILKILRKKGSRIRRRFFFIHNVPPEKIKKFKINQNMFKRIKHYRKQQKQSDILKYHLERQSFHISVSITQFFQLMYFH